MSERLKKLIGEELYGKIEEVAKANNVKIKDIDIIPNNYITLSRFNEVNEELKSSKQKIVTYDTQNKEVEKLLKNVNSENIGELVGKFDTMKTNYTLELEKKDKEIIDIKKSTLTREFLADQGASAKHINLLMKTINLDDIKLDNNNTLIGASDVVKNLKTEYSDLFVTKKNDGKPPKDTNNNNNNGGSGESGGGDIFDQLLSGHSY